jgi:hypothetical protein
MESRMIGWLGHMWPTGEPKNAMRIWVRKIEEKKGINGSKLLKTDHE